MANEWQFTNGFDEVRRTQIVRFDSFAKVTAYVQANCTVLGACVCEGIDLGPKGCLRPSVQLSVGREAYDAFFNSPGGYRAQYLDGPDVGQSANNALITLLEPTLTDAVIADCGEQRLSRGWIEHSFLANSAKIWIDEDEIDYIDATHDLDISRWASPCDAIQAPAGNGLWAPRGTRLMVFGAFMDPWGNEVVAHRKIKRRFEIHMCGYT